jgi:hypothetical protein
MQHGSEDLELVEAEEDVRELERHVADQQIRIKQLQAAGRNDDEMKAHEGLFLLSDALDIAKRRLQVERGVRGTRYAALKSNCATSIECRTDQQPPWQQ